MANADDYAKWMFIQSLSSKAEMDEVITGAYKRNDEAYKLYVDTVKLLPKEMVAQGKIKYSDPEQHRRVHTIELEMPLEYELSALEREIVRLLLKFDGVFWNGYGDTLSVVGAMIIDVDAR